MAAADKNGDRWSREFGVNHLTWSDYVQVVGELQYPHDRRAPHTR